MYWITKRVVLVSCLIAFLYIALTVYLINRDLVLHTVFGSYSLIYKLSLLIKLLGGLESNMSAIGVTALILVALLTGLNLSLGAKQFRNLTSKKTIFSFGGSFFGVMGVGCASCGLPVASVLGLSGFFVYFPFKGGEILILSILLLSFSLFSILRNSSKVCAIKSKP